MVKWPNRNSVIRALRGRPTELFDTLRGLGIVLGVHKKGRLRHSQVSHATWCASRHSYVPATEDSGETLVLPVALCHLSQDDGETSVSGPYTGPCVLSDKNQGVLQAATAPLGANVISAFAVIDLRAAQLY